ncbi:MAG: hypothetical protein ABIZ82_10850, partial [Candidatus Tumulicola sp.]
MTDWETRENPADNSGDAEVMNHERAPQPKHDEAREGYTRDTGARHPGFHKTATTWLGYATNSRSRSGFVNARPIEGRSNSLLRAAG